MSYLTVDPDTPRSAESRQFVMDGWLDTAPFEQLLGLQIEEVAQGRAVLSMPFTVKLCQGMGLLHGGALTTLADTAVAMAIKSLLPEGTRFATIELSTRFLAPLREGRVTATATVAPPQERLFRGEALLTDAQGRELVRFTSLFKVARGQGVGE